MKDPKAIRKAIMTARNIAAMVDPNFARVPLPQVGEPDTEEKRPPLNFMGGGYAAGGEVEQPTDYAAPDDMGLYSHAAATAASFPQAKASPEEFRSILANRGVKQSEFEASGYDKAFADQPQVTREQVAAHFQENRTPIEEKGFYTDNPNHESIAALEGEYGKKFNDWYMRKLAYREKNPDENLYNWGAEENDALQAELKQKRDALRQAGENVDSAGTPHHEYYMLPGGENYREIMLKHGGDDVKFKGVEGHLGGEPNVLTHLLMKDRKDTEGNRLLHLDELQSDWAQTGRQKGFAGPIDEDRYQDLAWHLDNSPEDEAEFEEMKKKIRGVSTAPYVTKTDDWVDLGLKRAMMEAAKGGHNKLAWSPGDVVADRYNLSKHIKDIHHEKNDDGTYNVMAYNHDGARVYDQDGLAEKDVVDALGKEVAGKIFSGEGVGYEEAQARRKNAEDAHINFKKQLLELELQNRMDNVRKRNPEAQWDEDYIQMAKDVLEEKIAKDPAAYANKFRLNDEHDAISDELKSAYSATRNSPHSPYRDWRTLSGVDLTIGGKGMKKFYDEMVPKRLIKLAKQHDPDAKFSVSTVKHPKEFYEPEVGENDSDYIPDVETDLPTLEITPKMRESILKKGFSAYADGGEVEGYADGGNVDPERVREYLKRIQSPLSSNPASVQKALQIAQSYRGRTGMETGVGSFYGIKQSMPAKDVTSTIGDIPGVKLKPKKQGSWEDFYNLAKDNEFVNVGGDLSGFGRLTHINGKELAWPVDLHAGADYMREPNPGRVWANIQAHSTGYKNKIADANKRGKDLYGILSPMGPAAVSSSHNMFDSLMAQIPNAGIDSDHIKEFDAALKRGEHLGDLKTKKPKLFAEYVDKLEKWPGLENAKEASEFARPEAGNINGTHRTKIVEFMDKAYWRDRGFPEVGVTRAAISNPDLMGVGGNKLGYRAVKLTADEPAGGKKIFEHSTYPVDTFGEYVMDLPLVQRHYAQPDVIDRMIANPTKSGQVVHPYSEDAMGRSTARKLFEEQKQVQPVNQRMLDSVMTGLENQEKYGLKKGGKVRSALMIAKGLKKG
jgi:hypothetical protein